MHNHKPKRFSLDYSLNMVFMVNLCYNIISLLKDMVTYYTFTIIKPLLYLSGKGHITAEIILISKTIKLLKLPSFLPVYVQLFKCYFHRIQIVA